jgi:hypothetical protein
MARSKNPIQFGINPRGLPYHRLVEVAKAVEAASCRSVSMLRVAVVWSPEIETGLTRNRASDEYTGSCWLEKRRAAPRTRSVTAPDERLTSLPPA